MQSTNNNQTQRIRTNHLIRATQVRVILSNGENGGVMDTHIALKMARDENLDLVEINSKSTPIVVRICDFGKMKYEEKKKQQAQKKNQTTQELKELTFKPNIAEFDLGHKLVQAKEFLLGGDRVKVTCRFRGREIAHSDLGKAKIDWFLNQLAGLIVENPPISMDGKLMSVVISPSKKQ